MNYLVDTNIILDIALERTPFVDDSTMIFHIKENENINLYLSASSVTDIYFIIKSKGSSDCSFFLKDLFQVCFIAKVDEHIILEASNCKLKDFEDAVQVAVARDCDANEIITRNSKDFTKSGLIIFHQKNLSLNTPNNVTLQIHITHRSPS